MPIRRMGAHVADATQATWTHGACSKIMVSALSQHKGALAAQEFLSIESIRDGIVVLKGGQGLRAVLMVSSLNFALKSEEEQDALTFQYENFLNSLDFPLQFAVHSRRLNIQPYLGTLEAREHEETNELLKVQIGEYIEFVRTFVELSNVVSKTFYAVIPLQPSIAEQKAGGLLGGLAARFGGAAKPAAADADEQFSQFKDQLLQRVDAVALGLRRMGLRAAQLNTEELIELFYGLYNPTESQKMQATDQKTKDQYT